MPVLAGFAGSARIARYLHQSGEYVHKWGAWNHITQIPIFTQMGEYLHRRGAWNNRDPDALNLLRPSQPAGVWPCSERPYYHEGNGTSRDEYLPWQARRRAAAGGPCCYSPRFISPHATVSPVCRGESRVDAVSHGPEGHPPTGIHTIHTYIHTGMHTCVHPCGHACMRERRGGRRLSWTDHAVSRGPTMMDGRLSWTDHDRWPSLVDRP